jgi:pimeloyl-ACP methyl ester carboxylesterase
VSALVLVGTTDRMAVHPELLEAAAERDHHAIDLMVGWMHSGRHRYGGHRSAGSWTAGSSRRTLERNLAVLGGDLAACAVFDPTSIAADVECPTLIVSGSVDKMTRASGGQRLVGVIGSDCEHHVVGEAGHMALFERAEEVNASLVDFLSRAAVVSG